jgi:hypothetical protein
MQRREATRRGFLLLFSVYACIRNLLLLLLLLLVLLYINETASSGSDDSRSRCAATGELPKPTATATRVEVLAERNLLAAQPPNCQPSKPRLRQAGSSSNDMKTTTMPGASHGW